VENSKPRESEMKIRVSRKDLLETAQVVQGVVSTKNALPILSNMLLEAKKDKISLMATDLDIAIIVTIPCEVSQEGATTVSAKRFTDILKELPEDDVALAVKKNNIVTIDCQNAHFKVNSLPREEFPKLPSYKDHESIDIKQETLKEMLIMTAFAVSHDETRYILNGVLFEIKPQSLVLVATDGRRLAYCEKKIETRMLKARKIIVPTKAITELSKTLGEGDSKIYFGENQATFDLGNTVIISRLIEGEYPRYEQVIPREHKEKLLVKKDLFLSATRRAGLLTNQDSQAIKLDVFKNRLVISKNAPDVGETREEMEVEYQGDTLSMGFNPAYLIDVLKNIREENVGIELTAPDKPGVIRLKDDYIYVVLPMQIG